MKKMNKTYEAPVAELFEMLAPATLVTISNAEVGFDDIEPWEP